MTVVSNPRHQIELQEFAAEPLSPHCLMGSLQSHLQEGALQVVAGVDPEKQMVVLQLAVGLQVLLGLQLAGVLPGLQVAGLQPWLSLQA